MRVCCLLVGFLVLLTGCGGETLKPVEVLRLESVTEASWSKLAGKRIFFGHQSVGENILDGISELVAANPKLGIRAVAVVGSSLLKDRIENKNLVRLCKPINPALLLLHSFDGIDCIFSCGILDAF